MYKENFIDTVEEAAEAYREQIRYCTQRLNILVRLTKCRKHGCRVTVKPK